MPCDFTEMWDRKSRQETTRTKTSSPQVPTPASVPKPGTKCSLPPLFCLYHGGQQERPLQQVAVRAGEHSRIVPGTT